LALAAGSRQASRLEGGAPASITPRPLIALTAAVGTPRRLVKSLRPMVKSLTAAV